MSFANMSIGSILNPGDDEEPNGDQQQSESSPVPVSMQGLDLLTPSNSQQQQAHADSTYASFATHGSFIASGSFADSRSFSNSGIQQEQAIADSSYGSFAYDSFGSNDNQQGQITANSTHASFNSETDALAADTAVSFTSLSLGATTRKRQASSSSLFESSASTGRTKRPRENPPSIIGPFQSDQLQGDVLNQDPLQAAPWNSDSAGPSQLGLTPPGPSTLGLTQSAPWRSVLPPLSLSLHGVNVPELHHGVDQASPLQQSNTAFAPPLVPQSFSGQSPSDVQFLPVQQSTDQNPPPPVPASPFEPLSLDTWSNPESHDHPFQQPNQSTGPNPESHIPDVSEWDIADLYLQPSFPAETSTHNHPPASMEDIVRDLQIPRIRWRPKFNLLASMFMENDITLRMATYLPIDTFLNLYCVSKKFHALVNSHYSTYMKALARRHAPDAMFLYPAAAYKKLCIRDPVQRPHPLRAEEPRYVGSLRWVQMLVYREAVVHDILLYMALEGHRFPPLIFKTVLKIWALLDHGYNGTRIALIHNRRYFADRDLFLALMFFVKLDMRFADPVNGSGECCLRRLMLGQRSLTVLQLVLRGRRLKSRLELMHMMLLFNYTPNRPNPDNLPIMGVPPDRIGALSREGWGVGSEKLLRPDELVLREAIRRRLALHRCFVDYMLWGYVDWKNCTDIPLPDLNELYERARGGGAGSAGAGGGESAEGAEGAEGVGDVTDGGNGEGSSRDAGDDGGDGGQSSSGSASTGAAGSAGASG